MPLANPAYNCRNAAMRSGSSARGYGPIGQFWTNSTPSMLWRAAKWSTSRIGYVLLGLRRAGLEAIQAHGSPPQCLVLNRVTSHRCQRAEQTRRLEQPATAHHAGQRRKGYHGRHSANAMPSVRTASSAFDRRFGRFTVCCRLRALAGSRRQLVPALRAR